MLPNYNHFTPTQSLSLDFFYSRTQSHMVKSFKCETSPSTPLRDGFFTNVMKHMTGIKVLLRALANPLHRSVLSAVLPLLISLFTGVPFHTLKAQTTKSIPIRIHWNEISSNGVLPSFRGAVNTRKYPGVPAWQYILEVPGPTAVKVALSETEYESLGAGLANEFNTPKQFKPEAHVYMQGTKYYAVITVPAVARVEGRIRKLHSANLKMQLLPERNKSSITYRDDPKEMSVLATGQWYKIAVSQYGIHQIDGDLLRSLGINTSGIDPRNIHIYGHPGGALPERIADKRVDDLEELSIWVDGESDGKWNAEDRILFYAEGPGKLSLNEDYSSYEYTENIYDTRSYYFLRIDQTPGKRISTLNGPQKIAYTSKNYLALQHFEEDKTNLLGASRAHEGSGQMWVGQEFTNVRSRDYSDKFSTLNIDPNEKAKVKMRFVARNSEPNKVLLRIDGQLLERSISRINITSVESIYARVVEVSGVVLPGNLNVNVEYPLSPNVSSGWLDYISINCKKQYDFSGESQIRIYDPASLAYPSVGYTIRQTPGGFTVWDITDALHPRFIPVSNQGNNSTISYQNNQKPWQHLAFDARSNIPVPEAIGAIDQQNLHGLKDIDEIIVYYKDLYDAADKLAKHREQNDHFNMALVEVSKIYNEFSAGKQDPTAIRDFVRTVYKHSKALKYVLLFGDGSYDFRGIRKGLAKESLVPVYETKESLNPITAFPSDDYFGMISDNEGYNLQGLLDVSIGRIPAHDPEDAMIYIDRLIRYETDPVTFSDWKNRALGIADDEDSNRYFSDIESLSNLITTQNPNYNINKIYLDAYEQVITSGGQRYPDVTKDIYQSTFKGVFLLTYLGHGGPTGLSQERILQINDILQWQNGYKTPIFLTATCSFTPFDDPEFVSVGEHTILHPSGGVSALLSTVRAVYASSNYQMTSYMIRELTKEQGGKRPKLGDLFIKSKNNNGGDAVNTQKFLIFGDPAMSVMIPTYDVITTKINGVNATTFKDTIHALDEVEIEGIIQDSKGRFVEDFNGKLYVTLFDKPNILRTKGNDPGSSPATFELRKNELYKGLVTIVNGKFKFSFTIPKEINFKIGNCKISYYASDEREREGHGYYTDLLIGGGGKGGFTDDTPPEIKLYLNDFKFVDGGYTGNNPVLLASLKDDHGINFSGSSIGHDLTAQLDKSPTRLILNEHFEPTLDNSKEGQVKYPLADLTPGEHTIKLTAWDIANNVAEASLNFIVIDNSNPSLKHVFNYPNPFTTSTNFQFEHNQAGMDLDVMIQIFTAKGTLVKTIEQQVLSEGNRVDDIEWDGTDDFGNKLSRGIYLYKIYVTAQAPGNLSRRIESPLGKLVILK